MRLQYSSDLVQLDFLLSFIVPILCTNAQVLTLSLDEPPKIFQLNMEYTKHDDLYPRLERKTMNLTPMAHGHALSFFVLKSYCLTVQ